MSKGDKVRVIVDVGGTAQEFAVEAEGMGHRLEINADRLRTIVTVVNRNGGQVRENSFSTPRVIALIDERKVVDE